MHTCIVIHTDCREPSINAFNCLIVVSPCIMHISAHCHGNNQRVGTRVCRPSPHAQEVATHVFVFS